VVSVILIASEKDEPLLTRMFPPHTLPPEPPPSLYTTTTTIEQQEHLINGRSKSKTRSSSDGKQKGEGEDKESGKTTPVPLSRLFYFADRLDVLLMIMGGFSACAVGSIM